MSGSIVLIGFMGAGKTEVGKELAQLTGMELVDTDALVQAKHGPIPEIFRTGGEPAFRAFESEAVLEAAAHPRRVIACGGGAILALKNYGVLRGAGTIVYLRTSAEALHARVGDGGGRPMLSDPAAFDRLLVERVPAYESAADVIVDTDGRTPTEIAATILERVRA